jgi:hypothetical protein
MCISFFNVSVRKDFLNVSAYCIRVYALILCLIYDPQQCLLCTLTLLLNIWIFPGIIMVSPSVSGVRENQERPEQDLEVMGQALQSSILYFIRL